MRSVLTALLFPLWVLAAPPEVKFPQAEVKAERNQFVVLKAEVKNGKGQTKYRLPKDGLSYLPSNLLADPSTIVFTPLKDGRYTFWAWSGNEDGASDLAEMTVVVGDGTPPGDVKPPPVKPEDPEQPKTGKAFVMLIRPDGPASQQFAAVKRLKAWEDVRKDGHEMKDYPRKEVEAILRQAMTEDAAAYKARLDGYVNKAVVLRLSADGKSSSILGVHPLPADDAAVKELVKE